MISPDQGALRPLAALGLRAYKLLLSPVFMAAGVRCRHEPSCSEYCAIACSRHGVWAGLWMALARLQRCRPGGSWGDDPPPQEAPSGASWLAPWRYGVWRLANPLRDEREGFNPYAKSPKRCSGNRSERS
jgi:hypothetical protein